MSMGALKNAYFYYLCLLAEDMFVAHFREVEMYVHIC